MTRSSWRERGAAAVEFALVVPILMAIIIAIVEFGMAYNFRTQINNASMTAARDYSFNKNATQAKAVVGTMVSLPPGTAVTLTGVCPVIETSSKNVVTVTVVANRPTLTSFFGNSFTIRAKGTAECV